MLNRLKRACKFGSNQAQMAFILSAPLVIVIFINKRDSPWWVYLAAGIFWPGMAFLGNLIDPRPEEKE